MSPPPVHGSTAVGLSETGRVTGEEAAEIAALVVAATAADGVGPVDDQVRSELAHGASDGARHVLGRLGGRPPVVAYSHVVGDGGDASAHLVVDPAHRRHGAGSAVVDHLLSLLGGDDSGEPGTLRVWAHGDTAGAKGLATARGFVRARDLWQMHRPLSVALPAPSYPPDVTVRTFEPGRDDEEWVALNAAAFATHPEQGRLTVDDLRNRIAEPWFDPAGFFLAERGGALVGSHWTKVHPAGEASEAGEAGAERGSGNGSVGEVYAVGIHPAAQGLGLGKALTLTGLHHLRDSGLDDVMLYVDGDNASAVGLYRRLGFTTTSVDVMYARRRSR